MSKRPREEEGALSAAELAQLLDTGGDIPALDGAGVKRLLLALERAITANRALRARHAAEPLRYLDSEVALHGAVGALQALAAAPEHYSALLASGSLPSLLDLLTHENSDVAAGVVALLGELLGGEETGEDAAGVEGAARRALADALQGAGALELLGHAAARFHASAPGAAAAAAAASGGSAVDADNAARDAEALAGTLELLQALLALRPALALPLCAAQPPALLATLLARLQLGAEYDECKGAAGELLAVLATPSGSSGGDLACARAIGAGAGGGAPGAATGVEALLQALAVYRRRGPRGADEEELIANVIDTLCICLLVPENRAHFLAAEGCELMLRLVREAGHARHGALRVLSYACTAGDAGGSGGSGASSSSGSSSSSSSSGSAEAGGPGGALRAATARALVRSGGLKQLFPAFMGAGLAHTRREHGEAEAEREEEYCVGVVEALLAALVPVGGGEGGGGGGGGGGGAGAGGGAGEGEGGGLEGLRLLAKFAEEGGSKAQRVVELRRKYAGRVASAREAVGAAEAAAEAAAGREEEEEEEEAAALAVSEAEEALGRAAGVLLRVDLIVARLLPNLWYRFDMLQ